MGGEMKGGKRRKRNDGNRVMRSGVKHYCFRDELHDGIEMEFGSPDPETGALKVQVTRRLLA
jgi:hypothetical protein